MGLCWVVSIYNFGLEKQLWDLGEEVVDMGIDQLKFLVFSKLSFHFPPNRWEFVGGDMMKS